MGEASPNHSRPLLAVRRAIGCPRRTAGVRGERSFYEETATLDRMWCAGHRGHDPVDRVGRAAERWFGHGHVRRTRRTCIRSGTRSAVVPLDNTVPGSGVFNSDLAFWGNTAVQGTYAGFRLIDVSRSRTTRWRSSTGRSAPVATNTVGNQGDVIVWGDLVIRSWNSGTPAPINPATGLPFPTTDPARYTTPGAFCGDWPMFREPGADRCPSAARKGVHIIDISDPTNPDVIALRRHAVRLAHGDAGARPRERPAARLLQLVGQHHVRRHRAGRASAQLPRHRHHRGAAGRPGLRLVPALRAVRRPGRGHPEHPTRATTPASSSATRTSCRAPAPGPGNGASVFTTWIRPSAARRKTRSGSTSR